MYFLILILIFPTLAQADWFQTTDQQAFQAFQQQHFNEAAQLFSDPYQQGVSWYRAGKYAEAEKAFSQVTRPEKQADAQYNLGNTFYQQKQFDKAVSAYQNAQRLGKNDADVMHNLQLAKKQVQQQQSQQNQADNKQKESSSQNSQNPNSSQSSQQSNHSQQNQKNNSSSQQNSNSAQNSEKSDQSQVDPSQQNASKNSQNSEHSDTAQNSQSQPSSAQSQPEPPKSSNSAIKSQENQSIDKQMAKNTTASQENTDNGTSHQKHSVGGSSPKSSQNQQDMLADAWLDQVAEDSEQLLRNQFKIDKYLAEQQRVAPPKQDW